MDAGIPISNSGLGVSDIPDIFSKIRDGCDVEIQMDHHAVAVVGVAMMSDGTMRFDVKSDDPQGERGGTSDADGGTEQLTYFPSDWPDPALQGKFRGPSWVSSGDTDEINVECVES